MIWLTVDNAIFTHNSTGYERDGQVLIGTLLDSFSLLDPPRLGIALGILSDAGAVPVQGLVSASETFGGIGQSAAGVARREILRHTVPENPVKLPFLEKKLRWSYFLK